MTTIERAVETPGHAGTRPRVAASEAATRTSRRWARPRDPHWLSIWGWFGLGVGALELRDHLKSLPIGVVAALFVAVLLSPQMSFATLFIWALVTVGLLTVIRGPLAVVSTVAAFRAVGAYMGQALALGKKRALARCLRDLGTLTWQLGVALAAVCLGVAPVTAAAGITPAPQHFLPYTIEWAVYATLASTIASWQLSRSAVAGITVGNALVLFAVFEQNLNTLYISIVGRQTFQLGVSTLNALTDWITGRGATTLLELARQPDFLLKNTIWWLATLVVFALLALPSGFIVGCLDLNGRLTSLLKKLIRLMANDWSRMFLGFPALFIAFYALGIALDIIFSNIKAIVFLLLILTLSLSMYGAMRTPISWKRKVRRLVIGFALAGAWFAWSWSLLSQIPEFHSDALTQLALDGLS